MIISTKGRYALRIMLDMALHRDETVKVKDIAARQKISEKYLERIIAMLNRTGLVRSTRGAQGGYSLTREPQEYTAGMILRVTEGDLAPVDCLTIDALPCGNSGICATVEVWKRMYEAINNVIDNITLQELVEIAKEKQGREENRT